MNQSPRDKKIRERRARLAEMTAQEHIDAAANIDAEYPSSSHDTAGWNLSVIKHLMWAQVKPGGSFPGSAS